MLGAESRWSPGLSYLLRMTTPPGVDTDMIMVAQYGLCTMWSHPLRVWSEWVG